MHITQVNFVGGILKFLVLNFVIHKVATGPYRVTNTRIIIIIIIITKLRRIHILSVRWATSPTVMRPETMATAIVAFRPAL